MTVCKECAGFGSVTWEAPPPAKRAVKRAGRLPPKVPVKKVPQPVPTQILELVDDFNLRVRQAREKLGLSHEDLGRKIGERVSVLRKIESKKMFPDDKLAQKLEHVLRVKLLVPLEEPKVPSVGLSLPREATLGDVVRLKKKKAEESEERGPS